MPSPLGIERRQAVRPGQGRQPGAHLNGKDVGLVRKDAWHSLAKGVSDLLVIGLVRCVDKAPHGIRIQVIGIGILVEPLAGPGNLPPEHQKRLLLLKERGTLRVHAFCRQDRPLLQRRPKKGKHVLSEFRRAADFHGHDFGTKGIAASSWHQATGSAGRPAVLIIQPGAHALLFCDAHGLSDACTPLGAHIHGLEAIPRVHEKAPHAMGLHVPRLVRQLLRIESVVPGPKGRPSQRQRRMFEFFTQLVHHLASQFQPNARRRRGSSARRCPQSRSQRYRQASRTQVACAQSRLRKVCQLG